MAQELLKREEVREEDTWRVEDMYPSNAEWEQDLQEILGIVGELEKLEGCIGEKADNLLFALRQNAVAGEKLMLAYNYANRLFDQDQQNSVHQQMAANVRNVYARVQEGLSFLEPEIVALSEETLDGFFREQPDLELYRGQIGEMRRLKSHCLSAEMEKLIAQTTQIRDTAANTFSVLDNADFQFPEVTDENGNTVRITHGRFIRLMESADRRVRKESFEKYYSVYKQFNHTLASLYDGHVRALIFYAKAKKYASTLEASVIQNDVSPQVYHNLVDTIGKHLDKMHRYVRLRKKCLGVEELHMYDIYTPMIAGVAKEISYEQAKETVLQALAPLGEEYLARLRDGFANRWIDVYENIGKRSGAYSAGAYGTHPYVLLNYSGNLDSVFTLAHEMGHALHSCYSNEAQPFIYSDYKIFVAEVASTTNEILLMEYLLKHTTDQKERAYLLNHYLDSFKGTVFRQTQFAEFEMESNALCESGEGLNGQNLNELYGRLNQKYYGQDMISDDEIQYEWSRIPHFYYDFYVYQYATSFCASVAIAKAILSEGEPAVDRYRKFLSGGCSKSPVELLKIAGVNMETPAPIEAAMNAFEGILTELEQLADQKN